MTVGYYGESTKRAKQRRIIALGVLSGGSSNPTPKTPPATGATQGIPGTWTPPGSLPPASVQNLLQGIPVTVVASPTTPWLSGRFVQTLTAGAAGRATWTGTGWVGGAAPLDAPTSTDTKEVIVDWLLDNGVTLSESALMALTKAELLSLVQDLLDDET